MSAASDLDLRGFTVNISCPLLYSFSFESGTPYPTWIGVESLTSLLLAASYSLHLYPNAFNILSVASPPFFIRTGRSTYLLDNVATLKRPSLPSSFYHFSCWFFRFFSTVGYLHIRRLRLQLLSSINRPTLLSRYPNKYLNHRNMCFSTTKSTSRAKLLCFLTTRTTNRQWPTFYTKA